MSGVTNPATISLNTPNIAAPLQSVKQFLVNLTGGNVPLPVAAVPFAAPGPIGGTTPSTGKFTTLTLTTAVATPAAGQIGLGDAAWIVIGAGGGAPAFTNSWVYFGSRAIPAFRKTADGLVIVKATLISGTNSQPAFTLPAGYRPLEIIDILGVDEISNTAICVTIHTDGTVIPTGGSVDGIGFVAVFYADA